MWDWKGAIWIPLRVHFFIIAFAKTRATLWDYSLRCYRTCHSIYVGDFRGASRPSGGGRGGGSVGGGGSHLDPELRRGPGVKKKKFRPFGPQFGLKIEGGGKGGGGGGVPGSATTFRWSATQAIWDYFLWKFCLIEARIAFYIVHE